MARVGNKWRDPGRDGHQTPFASFPTITVWFYYAWAQEKHHWRIQQGKSIQVIDRLCPLTFDKKVDLVSEFTVFAWKEYFKQAFPKLHIATFSCFPRDKRLIDDTVTCKTPWGLFVVLKDLLDALKTQAKRPKRRYYHAQGVQKILSLCRDVCHKPSVKVDWDAILIRYDENAIHVEDEEDEDEDDSDTGSMDGLGK